MVVAERTALTPSLAVGRDASRLRVAGLDSIRFVCATIVMIGHLNLLPDHLRGHAHSFLAMAAIGVWNTAFNGPAAVIVFFVISGFCIHFPYRDGQPLHLPSFYTRRAVRIVIPALGYLLLLRFVVNDQEPFGNTVLWSVVCEVVYYMLYPGLLYLRRLASSWLWVVAASALLALLVVVLDRAQLPFGDNAYIALGPNLTWIVGLPCWLLGCCLAEAFQKLPAVRPVHIWIMRFGIWALSVFANLLRFHSHGIASSSIVLLDLLSIPVTFWLGCEIVFASRHGFSKTMENAGTWSYSLYLIHTIAVQLLVMVGLGQLYTRAGTHWLVLLLALLFSYVYFLLVERPSHKLAIYLSRYTKPLALKLSIRPAR